MQCTGGGLLGTSCGCSQGQEGKGLGAALNDRGCFHMVGTGSSPKHACGCLTAGGCGGGQDAGQELWQPIGVLERIIDRDGYLFVMQGEKTLPEKIHAGMFDFLGLDKAAFTGKDMCAGGIQGYRRGSLAVTEVLEATVECALQRACIAPNGADQSNHRFDQSAFSLFMALGDYRRLVPPRPSPSLSALVFHGAPQARHQPRLRTFS